ncbi:unnamed protein product [Cunninghamella echinulata]
MSPQSKSLTLANSSSQLPSSPRSSIPRFNSITNLENASNFTLSINNNNNISNNNNNNDNVSSNSRDDNHNNIFTRNNNKKLIPIQIPIAPPTHKIIDKARSSLPRSHYINNYENISTSPLQINSNNSSCDIESNNSNNDIDIDNIINNSNYNNINNNSNINNNNSNNNNNDNNNNTKSSTKKLIPIQIPIAPPAHKSVDKTQSLRASAPAAVFNKLSKNSNLPANASSCLQGVVACLDIRTEDGDDVSKNFEKVLQSMGAKTRKTFSDNVTHLIYKNGSPSSLKKALGKKCKIVNLLWITNCKCQGKRLPEEKYLIDQAENLALSGPKKRRSMEPGKVKALGLEHECHLITESSSTHDKPIQGSYK